MDRIDIDEQIERHYHPENYEDSELLCPNDGSRLVEAERPNGPDDFDIFAYCKLCDYITD